MAYSIEFRRKVLLIQGREKLTIDEVANRFRVRRTNVVRWLKRIEAQRTRNKPATKIQSDQLKRDVERYPDAYQYERAERLGVSQAGIGAALKRLGISRKKNALSSPSG